MSGADKHVSNLVMLVARLVQQVKRFDRNNDVAKRALDYLQREDLTPSILREMTPSMERLKELADAEDKAGCVSVGGLAADMGMPVTPEQVESSTKFECSLCGKPTALADATDPSKTFCEECCPDHEYKIDPMTRRYHCEVCGKDCPEDHYLYHYGD